ncbi:hypothetical protein, partial [Flavobacterium cupreum]
MEAGAIATRLAVFAAVWWILSGGRPAAWWFGVPSCILAAGLSMHLGKPSAGQAWPALSRLPGFLGYFLAHSA